MIQFFLNLCYSLVGVADIVAAGVAIVVVAVAYSWLISRLRSVMVEIHPLHFVLVLVQLQQQVVARYVEVFHDEKVQVLMSVDQVFYTL